MGCPRNTGGGMGVFGFYGLVRLAPLVARRLRSETVVSIVERVFFALINVARRDARRLER